MNQNKGKYPLPKKSLGQNFLVHKGTIDTIIKIADILPDEVIVELGPGQGALTKNLGKKARKVIAIELDQELIEWMHENAALPLNVEIIHGDMLKVSFAELRERTGKQIRIIGNLPYNISAPMLFKIIKERKNIRNALLMLQKEVAERLISPSGRKEYGILSVILGSVARVDSLLTIPPSLFRPIPKVYSSLVRIDFIKDESRIKDFDFFVNMVKTAFQQRRKQLSNALKGLPLSFEANLNAIFKSCGLTGKERAERLDVNDFICLSNALVKMKK